MLKRAGKLDGIIETIGIGEKFEGIKEKISNIRDR